jgi:serine/threonine-protein kinase
MTPDETVSEAGPCPGPDELAAFSSGALPLPELERLAGHVGACALCEAALQALHRDPTLACLQGGHGEPLLDEPECAVLVARARDLAVDPGPATESLSAPAPAPGPQLPAALGPYVLLEKLGQGGMGVVYKARQAALDRIVALKMLRGGAQADPDALARFRVEGAAVARLCHAHVVQIYELGEHDGGLYYSMEYVEGGSLARRLARAPLPDRAAAELLRALARAVAAAHRAHVVHRDLKPSNVLLAADGTPKVTDFGLARLLDDGDGANTQAEAVLGTPSYMAPEQAAGRARQLGPPVDIYSLGAILYECLTGRPPFKGDGKAHTLDLVRKADVVPPTRLRPGVSPDLEAVCLRCLEKEPGRRYPSADALADDLDNWLAGRPTHARPLTPWRRAGRALHRHPAWAAAAAAALLAAALAPAGWRRLDPDRPRRETEEALARGQAVTLVGQSGGPRWSRWRAGAESSQMEVSAAGPLALHSWRHGLLELASDPGRDRYRLRAQVRHDRGGLVPDAGLFFAHRLYATSAGAVHFFGQLTFDDITDPVAEFEKVRANLPPELAVPPRRETAAVLHPHLSPDHKVDNPWDCRGAGLSSAPFAPAGYLGGDWHDLAVEVTPAGVRGSWDGRAMGALTPQKFVDNVLDSLATVADKPPGHPGYAPRGALGLYVVRGSASFRNVVLEPLPDP